MEWANMVPSVFIKAKDFTNPRAINECDVAEGACSIIGRSGLIACQRIGGLYRINTKDLDTRAKLLSQRVDVKGQSVHVYNDNPFRAGIDNPDQRVVKITVKDLPLSKGNTSLKEFLEEKGLTLTKDIQLGKIRNPETKELTDWLNGDRIAYVDKFDDPLPRRATVGSTKVRIFHEGQLDPSKSDLLCTRCYGRDHSRAKCTKPEDWCRLCQCAGHKAGAEDCSSVTAEPQEEITTVFGFKNPLSNHYACTVTVMGHTFGSAEHAYLHTKALNSTKPELAQKIKDAENAGAAKRISKDIPFNPDWPSRREEVMEDVLRAKLDQVPEFGQALLETGETTLVGAAPGDFDWGSGLPEKHTKTTKEEKWPGKNLLGKLQMRLREDFKRKTKKISKAKGPGQSASHPITRSQSKDPPPTGSRYNTLNQLSSGSDGGGNSDGDGHK